MIFFPKKVMRIQPNTQQQRAIESSRSLHELVPIANEILRLYPDKSLVIVCGPISTGEGTREEKLIIFNQHIEKISRDGYDIFDQMPWEDKIDFFHSEFYKTHDHTAYHWDILLVFYEAIFSSGKIKQAFFLPGWEKSTGASWEHKKCVQLGIEIIYL